MLLMASVYVHHKIKTDKNSLRREKGIKRQRLNYRLATERLTDLDEKKSIETCILTIFVVCTGLICDGIDFKMNDLDVYANPKVHNIAVVTSSSRNNNIKIIDIVLFNFY